MFQNVTVKQLIGMLLECDDLNSYVEIHTDNKDSEGRYHAYAFTGVDKKPTMDGLTGEMYTKIKFHNGDFIKAEKTGHWIQMAEGFSPYECSECGGVEFKTSKYCPNCGSYMAEAEVMEVK